MLHLFLRDLKLEEHLKAIKRYALGGAGDTMDIFLMTMLDSESHGDPNVIFDFAVKISS